MSNVNIPLDSGDFSVMSRRVVDFILSMPEQSLYIRGIRSWVGFKQTGLEYERDKRQAGQPKYSFRKLLGLAYNGIFSFSNFPVKMLTRLGTLVIFVFCLHCDHAGEKICLRKCAPGLYHPYHFPLGIQRDPAIGPGVDR